MSDYKIGVTPNGYRVTYTLERIEAKIPIKGCYNVEEEAIGYDESRHIEVYEYLEGKDDCLYGSEDDPDNFQYPFDKITWMTQEEYNLVSTTRKL